jgi:transcriptional regulator with XRE-family HTH domain
MLAELEDPQIASALTCVLRAVRRERNLSARAVADRMGMKLRTYQYYEAGKGRFSFKSLKDFAAATDSDFNGLVAAVLTTDPSLAAHSGDNKLASITLASLKAFSLSLGEKLTMVEPRLLIGLLEQAFSQAEAEVRGRSAGAPTKAPGEPDET